MTGHRSRPSRIASGLLLALALALHGSQRNPAVAQHVEGSLPHDFNEPIRLYTVGLGTFTRPISSPNAEAQAYLIKGFS